MADRPKVVMDPGATFRRLVPVDRLAPPIPPSDDVYVIAHMGIARIDVKQWRLAVDGLVERPFELDYEALTSLPATDVTAVLECFGNPVEPEVATRRVGNVLWRGVRLAHLLERAGVRPAARLVCPEGLDSGSFANVHSDRYVKDLPVERAVQESGRHAIEGWAWSAWPVSTVEVSADAGATWRPARVAPRGDDHQWQAFTCLWDAAAPGKHELRVRATDERGRTQPEAGRNRVHIVSVGVSDGRTI